MKNYRRLAVAINAMENCNEEWRVKHQDAIDKVMASAPSGSGFDAGTEIDYDACKENRLVFKTSFHHMNDTGYYTGWTEHKVIITPDLQIDFDIRITGRDKNQIKEYIGETFNYWLDSECEE